MVEMPAVVACKTCGAVLPADRHHYSEHLQKRRKRLQRDGTCRLCRAQQARDRWKAIRADPERYAVVSKQRRDYERKWMAENPEQARAKARRRYYKAVSTPEGRLAVNESQRLMYRLRREKDGVDLDDIRALKIKSPWSGNRIQLSRVEAARKASETQTERWKDQ